MSWLTSALELARELLKRVWPEKRSMTAEEEQSARLGQSAGPAASREGKIAGRK